MHKLKRSLSVYDQGSESEHPHIETNEYGRSSPTSRRTPSFDTMVIRGRTRYPSDRGPKSKQVDTHVAQELLNYASSNLDTKENSCAIPSSNSDDFLRPPNPPYAWSPKRLPYTFTRSGGLDGGSLHIHQTSGCSGTESSKCTTGRLPSGTSRISSDRDASVFVERYNRLARHHGVGELCSLDEDGSIPNSGMTTAYQTNSVAQDTPNHRNASKLPSKRFTWRKLGRSSSSKTMEEPEDQRITRKNSVSSLLGTRPKLELKCASLNLICRFGGETVVRLPSSHRATNSRIPTCLAATANYLVEKGMYSRALTDQR